MFCHLCCCSGSAWSSVAGTLTITSMSFIPLPAELWEKIIFECDRATLGHTSLVCKQWLIPSRIQFFKLLEFDFGDSKGSELFLDSPNSAMRLVRHSSITISDEKPSHSSLNGILHRLEGISITGLLLRTAMLPPRLEGSSIASSIVSLTIEPIMPMYASGVSPGGILSLLASFPRLRNLTLLYLLYRPDDDKFPQLPVASFKLQSLAFTFRLGFTTSKTTRVIHPFIMATTRRTAHNHHNSSPKPRISKPGAYGAWSGTETSHPRVDGRTFRA